MMSNEVCELKEHVRVLEDRLDWFGNIEDQLGEIRDDIAGVYNSLNNINIGEVVDKLNEVVSAQNNVADKLNKVIDALNMLNSAQNNVTGKLNEVVRALNNSLGAAKQPAAPPPFPEVFNDMMLKHPKHPKRQKFKPKVVKNDQPDGPDAA
jgi:septation ring formation regulator EzrA